MGTDATFTISGISSGIDWDGMYDTVLENAREVEEPWNNEIDTLELKIDLYDELIEKMKTVRTAADTLKLETTYLEKIAEFSVLSSGTSDSTGILTADVLTTASLASHEIEVIQKATTQTCYSNQITGAVASAGSFSISVGGRKGIIEVTATDTMATIVEKINTATDVTIDPSTGEAYGESLGVTASVFDNRLVITSTESGLGETVYADTYTRSSTGDTDKLGFTAALDDPSDGTFIVTDGTTTYVEGTDFTVETGSDEITWLSTGAAPTAGSSYTVTYTVNSNAFCLENEDSSTILTTLGLGTTSNYTAPQDAILTVDGVTVTRSSNEIDDLFTGVTLNVKGTGKVQMDIVQDAEDTVTAIDEFVTAYNDVMEWINTRLSESEVEEESTDDEDETVATSEEFRTNYGLLHGDSLLWQAKSQLRLLMMNPVSSSFSTKTGSEVYGTIGDEGLTEDGVFHITIDDVDATIDIKTTDSLSDIAARINSATEFNYDSDGTALTTPLLTASVSSNKLVITAATGSTFTLKDTSDALQYLGLDSSYTTLSQLGFTTDSEDYGKSGVLEFDEDTFMSALEDNSVDVAATMTTLMKSMATLMTNMVSATTQTVGSATYPEGKITSRIQTYEDRIDYLEERISDYESILELKMNALKKKYSNAETRLAELSEQASWLSSTLSALSGSS